MTIIICIKELINETVLQTVIAGKHQIVNKYCYVGIHNMGRIALEDRIYVI
jgi:hypothetical protein